MLELVFRNWESGLYFNYQGIHKPIQITNS